MSTLKRYATPGAVSVVVVMSVVTVYLLYKLTIYEREMVRYQRAESEMRTHAIREEAKRRAEERAAEDDEEAGEEGN